MQKIIQNSGIASLILIAVLALSACGFQLRGALNLHPAFTQLYIETQSGNFASISSALKKALKTHQIPVTEQREQAKLILRLMDEKITNNIAAISTDTRIHQYILRYRVSFEISNQQGKVIVPAQSINLSKTITLDSNQILVVDYEDTSLRREMINEATTHILARLASIQTSKAIDKAGL